MTRREISAFAFCRATPRTTYNNVINRYMAIAAAVTNTKTPNTENHISRSLIITQSMHATMEGTKLMALLPLGQQR